MLLLLMLLFTVFDSLIAHLQKTKNPQTHYNWFLIKSFMTEVPILALEINGLISL